MPIPSMEDSFKVRVDRAFGSLEASSSSSSSSSSTKSTPSFLSSLWCLTDEEIQRNEWIRDKVTPYKHKDEDDPRLKNPKPYSSFLDNLLENPKQTVADSSTSHQDLESDIQELDDEDDSEDKNQQSRLSKPGNGSNEDWDIRCSMGMDCTLDNEEEEDGHDKVVVGREERFYMREVNDYEVEIDSNNELPNSFTDVIRDPRANHMAAKLRLKEDDESASVPDYVLNPSNYTHYTFDSLDDVDEESNRKAYMETQQDEDPPCPRSIVFTPKKKSSDGLEKEKKSKVVAPISIVQESDSEVCVMEEDEPQPEIAATNKSSSRRYRTKATATANLDVI